MMLADIICQMYIKTIQTIYAKVRGFLLGGAAVTSQCEVTALAASRGGHP